MESDSGVSMTIKVSGLCRLHVDVLTISHNAAINVIFVYISSYCMNIKIACMSSQSRGFCIYFFVL